MVFLDENVCLLTRVSGKPEKIRIELTDPLQVPVGEVEAVEILQPLCDVYQLQKPVSYRSAGKHKTTHELGPIHICVLPDEVVDVTVIHPFRHKRKPVRL